MEWFSGGTGLAGTVSGLLSMAMMVGLIVYLALSIDPDTRLSTAAAPQDVGSSTGASSGEAGSN